MSCLNKSAGSRKRFFRHKHKDTSNLTFDKQNLLKQISDQIDKGLEIRYVNSTLKEQCVKNQNKNKIPFQRNNQMKFMIESLVSQNALLTQKFQQNQKKLKSMKKSTEYCEYQELETLCNSYKEQIRRIKKLYKEVKRKKRERRRKRRAQIRKKRQKQFLNHNLLQQLQQQNQQLQQYLEQVNQHLVSVRRKNIENIQRKTKLAKEVQVLKQKIRQKIGERRMYHTGQFSRKKNSLKYKTDTIIKQEKEEQQEKVDEHKEQQESGSSENEEQSELESDQSSLF